MKLNYYMRGLGIGIAPSEAASEGSRTSSFTGVTVSWTSIFTASCTVFSSSSLVSLAIALVMPDNQEKDEEENEEGDSPESLSENEIADNGNSVEDMPYFSYA